MRHCFVWFQYNKTFPAKPKKYKEKKGLHFTKMSSVLWRTKKAKESPFHGIVFSEAKAHKSRELAAKFSFCCKLPFY